MNAFTALSRSHKASFFRFTCVMLVILVCTGVATCDEIHSAAASGDLARVKTLLKENPDWVFKRDDKGNTPLILAAKGGHLEVAVFLLAHKADVNSKANDESFALIGGGGGKSLGGTPLHWAVSKDDFSMAQLLLTNGADLNAENGGTPLHWAIRNSRAMVELLLTNNANVNAKDEDGRTPLHEAAQGFVEMAELLLRHKADVNARDNNGQTPLHIAAVHSRSETIVNLLLTNGAEVNARDNEGNTPLHLAAEYCVGDIATANLLLGKGADANAKNKKGETPLSIPWNYFCPHLTELLQKGGGTNSSPMKSDIIDAARNGDAAAVKALLKKNPRLISKKDDEGRTALDWAALYNNRMVVELLVANGAKVNAKGGGGMTPLHWAASDGAYAVTQLLVTNGAKVNLKDAGGNTALHYAARACAYEVAKLLLENGASVNAKEEDGWTPLHWAARDGCVETVELLLAYKATVNATNKDGESPIDFANTEEIHSLLKRHLELQTKLPNSQDYHFMRGTTPK